MKNKIKITWALDPFSKKYESWKRTAETINYLSTLFECEVQPAYVVGYDLTHWVGNMVPNNLESLMNIVKEKLNGVILDVAKFKTNEPDIIVSEKRSRRADASVFARYFEDSGSELVLINSQSRELIEKFFIGSFVESLMVKTKKPIFIVSESTKEITKLSKTLIPSDLSDKSRIHYENFIDSKINFSDEAVLYHRVFRPAASVFQTTNMALGGNWVNVEQYSGNLAEKRKEEIYDLHKKAASKNYSVKTIVENSSFNLVELILKWAEEEDCDYLTVPSFSGRLDFFLLGSVTRELIIRSNIPVLVVWTSPKKLDTFYRTKLVILYTLGL